MISKVFANYSFDSTYHAPSSLHTELLEEGSCNDSIRAGKGVRIEQSTTNNADDNDAESATNRL